MELLMITFLKLLAFLVAIAGTLMKNIIPRKIVSMVAKTDLNMHSELEINTKSDGNRQSRWTLKFF